ncbi:MAG: hypothetical protein NC908_03685 [Candidatus Omnitrophica bacterium]|nr:hypothetical protein [Candidatus Omnitrophota bacterium]
MDDPIISVPKIEITTETQFDLKSFLQAIDYRVARTKKEWEDAYRLVYKEYLKRGYVKDPEIKLKLSIYNALPETTTFIAITNNEVLATATLIPDSPLGLPMDEIYHQELEQFRHRNKKICEISMLASNTELFDSGVSLMLNSRKLFLVFYLFKIIFDYAKDLLKLDFICITVNPKHALTYDFLLFKDLGKLKYYKSVNNAPAIAKYLDLNSVEEECKQKKKIGLYQMFFLKKTSAEKFSQKFTLTSKDLKEFFVDKTNIFKDAKPAQLAYLRKWYPDMDY